MENGGVKSVKLLQVEDFLKNRVLRNLESNKSETYCAYFENNLNEETNSINSRVVLLDIKSKKTEYLAVDFEPYGFFFKEDLLILQVKKNEQTYLYSYDIKTKAVKQIISFPFDLKESFLSADEIYFAADIQKNDKTSCAACSQKGPYYNEGVGVAGERITGLFKSSYDGKNIKIITSLDMNVDQVDFDGLHNRIMFTVFRTQQLKSVESDVYTYDMKSEALTKHTDGHYRIGFIKSMTDNKMIFTGTDLRVRSRNDNQQLYLIDTDKMCFDRLGDYIDKSNEICAVITDSSCSSAKPVTMYKDAFYHIRVERNRDVLYKTMLDGTHSIIETGLKKIDSYQVLEQGILICGLKNLDLHELYLLSDETLIPLTENNKWLELYSLSPGEQHSFMSEDIEIDGYVFKPANLDINKKYPGVLIIHGGPKTIFTTVFMHDVQLLCANGYFVYFANPIGSDGRGDEFSNIRGRFLELPYEQLMTFTELVLKEYPQMDENALGVTGGSYGGLMTNHIITKTSRFKAAVSERGISNMMTAFTSSDIGYKFIFEYMGNSDDFWTNPSLYMKASPIMKANQVKTPTLFIHGKCDYRCHYTESLNMYGALNYHGVASKFCLFDGENHGLSGQGKPRSRKKRYEEILAWFNTYLKEETLDGLG